MDGEKWVTDINAQHVAEVEAAEQQKSVQLLFAKEKIILWQTELQLGIISDEDKEKLISWVNYIKAVQAVDTQKAHNIIWPKKTIHINKRPLWGVFCCLHVILWENFI